MKNQSWLELKSESERLYVNAVWIPLRASVRTANEVEPYHAGFEEEFLGVGTVAIPLEKRAKAEGLSWSHIGLIHEQRSYAFENSYKPADVYQNHDEVDLGLELVLHQGFEGAEDSIWHLHQDFVIALGLLREGDSWVAPNIGYVEVAKLSRNAENKPNKLEVKSEYLRDYLAARRMALRITVYHSRTACFDTVDHIKWSDNKFDATASNIKRKGCIFPIHPGGEQYGATMRILKMWRNDVDPENDVPVMGIETNENVETESWSKQAHGEKIHRAIGEYWRDEWIEPSDASLIVRGDDIASTCHFIIDASGKKKSSEELDDEGIGQWLWFSSHIAKAILSFRGSSISWYTHETGSIQFSPGYGVHFGINPIGLVTVYAYDIARLPEWQKRIWAGQNVAPDGKVSSELLSAQVKATITETDAPESLFRLALSILEKEFIKKWQLPLFYAHNDRDKIIESIDRFKGLDQPSILSLAKDIAHLTVDSFNVNSFRQILSLKQDDKLGSLKLFQKILSSLVDEKQAHALMAALFAVYDLRLSDAHLPSSSMADAFKLLKIDAREPFIIQSCTMIESVAKALITIFDVMSSKSAGDSKNS